MYMEHYVKKHIYFLLFELLPKAFTLMEGHVEINQHSNIVIFHIDYFMMVFFTKVIKQAFWTDICTMQYSTHALQSSRMQACWMLDKHILVAPFLSLSHQKTSSMSDYNQQIICFSRVWGIPLFSWGVGQPAMAAGVAHLVRSKKSRLARSVRLPVQISKQQSSSHPFTNY